MAYFYQSMIKQALACVQSHQSLPCSRTGAKWANIRHILSVNAQTSLIVCAVLPEPSLLSHMHKNGCVYGIFYQSMFKQALACKQFTRAFTALAMRKLAYIRHILSVNAQMSLIVCAVLLEPSLTWTKYPLT